MHACAAYSTINGIIVVVIKTIIKRWCSQRARLADSSHANMRCRHLFLGVEGLIGTVVLHFELMTALICYGRNHGSIVIIWKVDLSHLHCAIYTSSHVLRDCIFTYYVV